MATRQKAGGWGEAGSYHQLAASDMDGPAEKCRVGGQWPLHDACARAGRAPIATAHAMAQCAAHVWRRERLGEAPGSLVEHACVCIVDRIATAWRPSPGQQPCPAWRVSNSLGASDARRPWAAMGCHAPARPRHRQKRGSCDALAPGVNKARPRWDSSARATQPPQPCERATARSTAACLTANLLDPLLGLPDSISPPPLSPRLLHPIAHLHAAARQHHEAGAPRVKSSITTFSK